MDWFRVNIWYAITIVHLVWIVCGARKISPQIGVFWQLTDVHFDANYSSHGTQYNCHQAPDRGATGNVTNGEYGNYNCDSPWKLVTSAVQAMKKIYPDPDFILWTGDSIPHIPDNELNPTKVFTIVKNVTALLQESFPDTRILPSLGNHDAWPANQVPPAPADYYSSILGYSGWDTLLSNNSQKTFNKGGYYSVELGSGVRLISLNTILWYEQNQYAFNRPDPSNQIAWLNEELLQARQAGDKVMLAGHIPPGMMARVPHFSWYIPQFNSRLVQLLQEFHDVITVFITGHEHTDGFHIVNGPEKNTYAPQVPILMAPAVTPWKSSIPGIGANNPAIRYYLYNRTTGQVLDYNQYYLNLTAANSQEEADWLLEYQASSAYGLTNISGRSLHRLVSSFLVRHKSELFEKYYGYNSVGYDKTTSCVASCKQMHICSIMFVDYARYSQCMRNYVVPYQIQQDGGSVNFTAVNISDPNHGHQPHPYPPHPRPSLHHKVPGYMHYVIYALVSLVVVLFIVITLLCCCFRPHNRVVYFTQPRYVLVS